MFSKFFFTIATCLVSFIALAQDEIMINGEPCGMHGSSQPTRKEYAQNVFKNRYNLPASTDFDTRLTLQTFIEGRDDTNKYSQQKAAEITGYVYDVKVGGVETCNCKTTDPLFKDTHIELTLNSEDTGPENRFIVEVTPRIRMMMEDQGIDWTTSALKSSLKGRMVRIQGWLFYDQSHETEAFSLDRDDNIGRKNWRSTPWEIHPITQIEVLDEMLAMATPEPDDSYISPVSDPPSTRVAESYSLKKAETKGISPADTLIMILLGAILGMVGQGARVLVGLKKLNDEAAAKGSEGQDLFNSRKLVVSLFIAFAIGGIAGVLSSIDSLEIEFTKSVIFSFIAAGYAGTDLIEGFINKTPVKSNFWNNR
jgi:hypothetical protein